LFSLVFQFLDQKVEFGWILRQVAARCALI
jgi:hypothetical protein